MHYIAWSIIINSLSFVRYVCGWLSLHVLSLIFTYLYQCPRTTLPVPHHHWIHALKVHGALSGYHLWGDQMSRFDENPVCQSYAWFSQKVSKYIQISSFLCIHLLISHVSLWILGKKNSSTKRLSPSDPIEVLQQKATPAPLTSTHVDS